MKEYDSDAFDPLASKPTAQRLGLSKSEYARLAIAELSQRLAAESAAASRSMDESSKDGLA